MTVTFVKTQLRKVIKAINKEKAERGEFEGRSGGVSKADLMQVLQNKEACAALTEVGVDVCGLVDNMDQIFEKADEGDEGDEWLKFEEFANIILQLRGSNTATVKDIVDLRKFIKASQRKTREEIRNSLR